MRTPTLALIPLLLAPHAALAAPAPMARAPVADAVVAAKPGEDAKKGVDRLKSKELLATALSGEAVRKLPSLKGQGDPAAWVARRLRVSQEPAGKGLRVALTDCPPKEALTILTAVVDRYAREMHTPSPTARVRMDDLQRIRQVLAEKRQADQESSVILRRLDHEIENLAGAGRDRLILQPPRLVVEAKPGK